MSRKWGFHSGVGHMQDCQIRGDLYVQDDIVFSDVSAGVLGVTGGIDMQSTTSAIGIDLGGTFSTAAINIDGSIGIGIRAGTSSSRLSLSTYANKVIDIYTDCSGTSGSNTANAVYVNAKYSGVGQVGRAAEFVLYPTVKMGAWCNALKGYTDFSGDSDGGSTGLASAICAEMKLPNGACNGALYPLEIEWVGQASTAFGAPGTGTQSGFIYLAASGTVTDFDSDGVFMSLNGLTAGSGKLLSAQSFTLRCDLSNGTTKYLVLSDAENSLNIPDGVTTGITIGNATTGISLDGDFTDGIKIAGSNTVADGIEINAACTANGINISGAGATGINIAAQTTMGIAIATAADVGAIAIDAGTTNHAADGSILDINLDVEGQYSVNAINVNLDFETTGMAGTDVSTAFKADINELLVHTDGAGLYGTSITLTGFATGRCDLVGHLVTFDGSKTAGDTSAGFKVVGTQTTNHSGEVFYGNFVDLSGMTLTDGTVYGQYLDVSFTNGSTAYGLYINSGTNLTAGIAVAGTPLIALDISGTSDYGILFADGYTGQAIKVGSLSSTTPGTGCEISDSVIRAVDIHADDNNAAIGSATTSAALRARAMYYASVQNEAWGIHGLAKISGLARTANVVAGVVGAFETTGTCSFATGSGNTYAAGLMGRVGTSGSVTIGAGTYVACVLAFGNNQDSNAFTNTGYHAFHAALTDVGTPEVFDVGLCIEDSASTTGIQIGTSETGLTFTGSYTTTAIQLGASGSTLTLAAHDDHVIDIDCTCASTDGGNSVRPIHMTSHMTGTGGVGGRAEFVLSAEAALGGWANALKASTTFNASGSVTGLGSCMATDLTLSAGTSSGTYACYEANIIAESGASTGTATAFFALNVDGALEDTLDGSVYLMRFGDALDAASGKFIDTDKTAESAYGGIRVLIEGVGTKYIRLYDAA